ncbi:hypothetical protein M413DRAFT_324473 [Hebeloma cylindrosporum]|uniref:Uncharacterized protein n=1 Tax=Hebeloma cylindrosporum TaxID=76867 RepID=A0A0C3BGL6_HEBCY|nr:hypothetical protein M413DRAFT_324473 [Hebeloma cylindrosporum h7]
MGGSDAWILCANENDKKKKKNVKSINQNLPKKKKRHKGTKEEVVKHRTEQIGTKRKGRKKQISQCQLNEVYHKKITRNKNAKSERVREEERDKKFNPILKQQENIKVFFM